MEEENIITVRNRNLQKADEAFAPSKAPIS